MAKLINGNGNPAIYAAEDADMIASLSGNVTAISDVGNQMAATAQDANTIGVADGVIITKEGRRIQLDAGSTDIFTIPTGSTGVTNYYIIGYKLTTAADSTQTCETFVQKMNSSSETIPEDTFRGGATDVYVSLYRVKQVGVNLDTISALLPSISSLSELKSDLIWKDLYDNTGSNDINLPTSWSEIDVSIFVTSTQIVKGRIIPSDIPSTGARLFTATYNYADVSKAWFAVTMETGKLNLTNAILNGASVLNTTRMVLKYR